MKVLKLIFKNSFRHKLRTFLTIVGISIAVMAFGMLRTVYTAWHAGLDMTSPNRLVTRQAVSFIFPLPYAYREQILKISGVQTATFANWFQGRRYHQHHRRHLPRRLVLRRPGHLPAARQDCRRYTDALPLDVSG